MTARTVLDEALPRKLAHLLTQIGCATEPFPEHWKGMKDRALLDALDDYGNAVLLTCDRNLPFQQRLAGRGVGVVILSGQRLSVLVPNLTSIALAVTEANSGFVVTVDASGKVLRVS